MKKTTTRLATVGVIIVLGAFAMALAQHDARKRDSDAPVANEYANQAAVPIAVEGDWSALPNVVRGNNDSLPSAGDGAVDEVRWPVDDSASTNPLRDSESSLSGSYSDELSDVGPTTANGSPGELVNYSEELPEETYSNYDLPSSPDSSQVIAATSQEPVIQSPVANSLSAPPAWLSGNDGAQSNSSDTSALTPLPTEIPSLPPLPSGSSLDGGLTNVPANNTASGNLPSDASTYAPTYDRDTTNALQNQPAPTTLPQPTPRSTSNTNSMSDTQRGAMLPTNVTTNQLPPRNITPSNSAGLDSNAVSGRQDPASQWPSARTAANPNAAPTALVSNQPGSRYLDGSQNPIMLIQKRAPDEIQVGKKATFVITVRNAGNATAHNVTVVDSVPQGVRFVEATPNERPNAEGLLTWRLGEMAAGDEKTITLQLVPEAQGEIGSVASVHFAAQASVRTVATLPRVEVLIEAQPDVLIGGSQQINVTIKNSGTGVARNVRLEADIPPQLRHESGEAMLEAVIGDLRPNEVKRLGLVASASQAGRAQVVVRAVDDDGVQAEQAAAIDVRAPQLTAAITGPSLRYLERQAVYHITVQNTGTAAATDLNFVAHLPAGLKFISTDNQFSSYDPNTNTVSLGLTELPAGQPAQIALTVLPVELGPQLIKFNVTGDLGVSAEAKGQVMVDGLAELAFTIGQDNGTVEVGATTTYSVQVTNVGNKPDKDVQLLVQLPNGALLVPGGVNAPVEWRAEGNKLIFAPLPEMRNRDQQTFRFQVQHNQAGNQVVRTQLTSTNWPVAVVKEEGTLVYNDK